MLQLLRTHTKMDQTFILLKMLWLSPIALISCFIVGKIEAPKTNISEVVELRKGREKPRILI